MNKTSLYFEYIRGYRASLREVWAEFDKQIEKLERYRGSDGYEQEASEAVSLRDSKIALLQEEFREKFGSVINSMRQATIDRPMTAPTSEQLALLQVLQMRETISRDELLQAGKTLESCPAALSVLSEIAVKNGYSGARFQKMTTAEVMQCLDSLKDSANRLCSLRKCDSKREMIEAANINSPTWAANALFSYRTDCDPADEQKAMSIFGDVDADTYDDFCAAVND